MHDNTLCSECQRFGRNCHTGSAANAASESSGSGHFNFECSATGSAVSKDLNKKSEVPSGAWGLENFQKDREIEDYTAQEILWAWPELEDTYYDDIITVFGHTPTMSYGNQYKGKILRTRTWIDIDVGAGWGLEPVLLRLEGMKQFRNEPA